MTQSGKVVWRALCRCPLACPSLHAVGPRRGAVDCRRIRKLDRCCHEAQESEPEDDDSYRWLLFVSHTVFYTMTADLLTAFPNVAPQRVVSTTTSDVEAPISVFRPRASKWEGQTGSHHGSVVCWDLYDARTWPAVPIIVAESTKAKIEKARMEDWVLLARGIMDAPRGVLSKSSELLRFDRDARNSSRC